MESTVAYDYGQYVQCVSRTDENCERLNLGEVYMVVGITSIGDDIVYSVKDSEGNLYHSIDRFKAVKVKNPPTTVAVKLGEMNNTFRYQMLQSQMLDTYIAKNTDYGNSFVKTYEDYGMMSVAVRLSDKYLRLKQLIANEGKGMVKDESIRDTLLDMANYAMMAVMELDAHKEVSVNADQVPCRNALSKSQICFIASLTKELGLDRYNLPTYLSPVKDYKTLTESEASVLIDKLNAMKEYVNSKAMSEGE